MLGTVGISITLDVWAASVCWKNNTLRPLWGFLVVLNMPLIGLAMLVSFELLKPYLALEPLVYALYIGCVVLFLVQLAIVLLIDRHRALQSKRKMQVL